MYLLLPATSESHSFIQLSLKERLCSSGSSPAHPIGFRGAPQANTFPPEADSLWSHFSTCPSASRNTFSVSTITDGNARIGGRSTFPALTFSWLYIEPSRCGGVRPAGDLVDGDPTRTIPTLDRTLVDR